MVGGTATFGHVVADEAQDLSAMQLRAIGRRCRFGSATLLGDLAQRTTPWSAARWGDAVGHLGRAGPVEQLPRGRSRRPRRCSTSPTACCPRSPPTSARPSRSGASPARCGSGPWPRQASAAWLQALDEALAEDGSVGLVVADAAVVAAGAELTGRGVEFREVDRFDTATRLALVAASAVKGLEFDQVVLVEPADIADPALGRPAAAALHRPHPGRARPPRRPRQAAPAALAPAWWSERGRAGQRPSYLSGRMTLITKVTTLITRAPSSADQNPSTSKARSNWSRSRP